MEELAFTRKRKARVTVVAFLVLGCLAPLARSLKTPWQLVQLQRLASPCKHWQRRHPAHNKMPLRLPASSATPPQERQTPAMLEAPAGLVADIPVSSATGDDGAPVATGNTTNAAGKRKANRSWKFLVRDMIGRTLPKVAYLTIMVTWLMFRFLLRGSTRQAKPEVECINRQALLDAVLDRGDRGLLTVSNHMSVYDDPGLWSALIPFWRTGQKKMRWAICTDDIYNANRHLRGILRAGRTLPIKRSRGMEQPLFKAFFQKLEEGEWGHIFAEGGIRQPWRFSRGEPILGDFKAGIGRLLLRSKHPPMVLPMYHIGMHQIAPETPVHKRGRGKLSKALPNIGRSIRVYVGEPIDVSPIVNKCKIWGHIAGAPPAFPLRKRIGDVRSLPWTERSSREEVRCHQEIAAFVREHVLKLEAVARRDYYGSDPDASPYSPVE